MSIMLDRIAKAIQDALKQPRFTVKVAHSHPQPWQVWDIKTNTCFFKADNHTEVDDECDRLNAENVARKAVESLKELPEDMLNLKIELFMVNDAIAAGINRKHVWETLVNAIL